jgi:phosphoribosyl-AMP cyclohydrolase
VTEQSSPPVSILFGSDGLIPAVIQDAATDRVLMVGFMNSAALAATRSTKRTHFWSRSRGVLWKKGETSGHEQIVEEIYVNCEHNSLLIMVRQLGAACHEGYPTCYFRRIEDDGSLTTVAERWFDPAEVYERSGGESLESRTRRWYGAYGYLADNDLSDVSTTSKRLHDPQAQIHNRIADELSELAGVLTGKHRHNDLESDILLEGSQSLYWLALMAVQAGVGWGSLRPDRALVTSDDELSIESAARLLIGEANYWSHGPGDPATVGPRCHAAIALVAQACRSAGVSPVALIRKDLAELESKSYLASYFAQD